MRLITPYTSPEVQLSPAREKLVRTMVFKTQEGDLLTNHVLQILPEFLLSVRRLILLLVHGHPISSVPVATRSVSSVHACPVRTG